MKFAELGDTLARVMTPEGFLRRHPHTIGQWNENNTLYLGAGIKARTAHPYLRLSKPEASPSVWRIPPWLKTVGLTYHNNPARWINDQELKVASRGQEFVSNIADRAEALNWLHAVRAAIEETYENVDL